MRHAPASYAFVLTSLLLPATALAQVAPPSAAGDAAPSPATPTSPAPAPTTAAPATAAPPPEVNAPAARWSDRLQIGAFVDFYGSLNVRTPRPQPQSNLLRAYDGSNGFHLALAQVEASMPAEPVGATVTLRFGPTAQLIAGGDALHGLERVGQAFASWKPGGKAGSLTLIAGKFDTIYGAEVVPSFQNLNYSRGALYWLGQPLFHTGLRADWQASEAFVFRLIAVNGWNNTGDNNLGKSVGAQAGWTSEKAAVTLGWLGGPENADVDADGKAVKGANSKYRHLLDLVVDLKPTSALRLLANGTFVADQVADGAGGYRSTNWLGASLGARYGLSDRFGVAARGEYYTDKHSVTFAGASAPHPTGGRTGLVTGTLTLEAIPVPELVIRLEGRLDRATRDIFPGAPDEAGVTTPKKLQGTVMLGVVAKTF